MNTQSPKNPTAALIIIGNEILSGRTVDKNLNHIALELAEIGVIFSEVRVVRDDEDAIIEAVNTLRAKYDYVFTTGGIGPTHDDITAACIAKAFGRKMVMHPDAEKVLRSYYKPDMINEARLRMASMPEGAELIPNPTTGAPGFKVENVYVMAGVPSIMQAMFGHVKLGLRHGEKIHSVSIKTTLREGDFAKQLEEIQNQHPEVEIGSYPSIGAEYPVTLVIRGLNEETLKQVKDKLGNMLKGLGGVQA